MAEEHGPVSARGRELPPRTASRLDWAPYLLVIAFLVMLYYRVTIKLVSDWYNIPDFSHGFLIPFFAAYVLWDKRKALGAIRIQQSWSGVPLVAAGLITLIAGVYGAELFLSRVSLVLLLTGLVWTLLGKAMLRGVRFALFVLLLAIPFPSVIFNHITFPLQLLSSRVASSTLPVLGVPVLREGNVIQLPTMQLEVAEACSGIRSLMSLLTIAVMYGYFMERSGARRLLLALASIPIAVGANVVRIVGTGLCVQYWNPEKALGFFHEFSGWLMFIVSFCCLYILHRAMRLLVPESKRVA